MKKILNIELLSNLLWTVFGLMSGFQFYNKEEYLAAILLFVIGLLYLYRLIINIIKNNDA